MKIFSKFQDYYDSALAMGVDDHIHYYRNEEEIIIDYKKFKSLQSKRYNSHKQKYPRSFPHYHNSVYNTHCYLIGFCGKIYPVIELKTGYSTHNVDDKYSAICYSEEDVFKYFSNNPNLNKNEKERFMREYTGGSEDYIFTNGLTQKMARSFFDAFGDKEFENLFMEHKVPVFVIPLFSRRDEGKNFILIKNAELKKFKFYRVMDTYTAFQEISMYISGVIGMTEKETVGISDEHLKEAKGFYDYSFKTLPTKKR